MRRNLMLFTFGGAAYVGLELAWRARSHWTMFLLGGGCFLAIGQLGRVEPKLPLWARSVIGSGICTMGELLTGMAFNDDYRIWDYRKAPMNYHGQICLPFTLLWIPVSALAAVLFEGLDGFMQSASSKGNYQR